MAIIHQGPLALKSKGMIGHNYVRHHFKLVQEEEAVVLEWSKSAGGARVGAVRVTANALVACRAFKDAKANYMMIFPAGPTAAEKVVTACADSAADMEAWKQAIEGSSDGVTAGSDEGALRSPSKPSKSSVHVADEEPEALATVPKPLTKLAPEPSKVEPGQLVPVDATGTVALNSLMHFTRGKGPGMAVALLPGAGGVSVLENAGVPQPLTAPQDPADTITDSTMWFSRLLSSEEQLPFAVPHAGGYYYLRDLKGDVTSPDGAPVTVGAKALPPPPPAGNGCSHAAVDTSVDSELAKLEKEAHDSVIKLAKARDVHYGKQIDDLRADLAAEKTAHGAEKTAHAGTNKQLASTKADLEKTSASLAAEKDGHAVTTATLKAEVAAHTAEKAAHASTKGAHAATAADLTATKAANAGVEADLAATKASLADTSSKLAAAQKEAADFKVAAKAEQDRLAADIARLTAELAASKAESTSEKNAHGATKATLAASEAAVKAKTEEVTGLTARLGETEAALAATKKAQAETVAALDAAKATIGAKDADIAALKAEIEKLNASLTAANGQVAALTTKLAEAEKRADGLAGELAASKKDGEAKAATIAGLQTDLAASKKDGEAKAATIAGLQTDLAASQKACAECGESKAALSKELEGAKASIKAEQAAVAAEKSIVASQSSQIEVLKTQLAEAQEIVSKCTCAATGNAPEKGKLKMSKQVMSVQASVKDITKK